MRTGSRTKSPLGPKFFVARNLSPVQIFDSGTILVTHGARRTDSSGIVLAWSHLQILQELFTVWEVRAQTAVQTCARARRLGSHNLLPKKDAVDHHAAQQAP